MILTRNGYYFGENGTGQDELLTWSEFNQVRLVVLLFDGFFNVPVLIQYAVQSIAPDNQLKFVEHHGCADVSKEYLVQDVLRGQDHVQLFVEIVHECPR